MTDGGSEPRATPLPFSLSFVDGQGRLSLRDVATDALTIDRLELEIKGLTFPFDLTSGPDRLRDRWLEVVQLELTLPRSAIERELTAAVSDNPSLSELELDFVHDELELVGRIGPKGASTTFVLHAAPDVEEDALTIRPDFLVLFGPPTISFQQLAVLLGELELPLFRATEGLELRAEELPRKALWQLLPPAGYRIPDCRNLKLAKVQLSRRSGAQLDFQRDALAPSAPSTRALALAEVAELLAPGDRAARTRDLETARSHYAVALAQEPGHVTIVERIAWLDLLAAPRREAARVGCERALANQETPGLHAILGSLSIAENNREQALTHFRAAGRELGTLGRARLLSFLGRLQLDEDPKEATNLLESALTLNPRLVDALEGLRDAYAALRQRGPLQSVAARLTATSDDPEVQCRVLTGLGKLWHHRFGDIYRATDAYEQALLAHPDDHHALFGLAECYAAKGEYQASLRCLDATATSAAVEDDSELEVAAHIRAGELWEEMGDVATAVARYRRAARIAPDSVIAVEKAAMADWHLGRLEKAAAAFSHLTNLAADAADQDAWRRALDALCTLQLDHFEAPGVAIAALDRYLSIYEDDEAILELRRNAAHHDRAIEVAPVLERLARDPTRPPPAAAPDRSDAPGGDDGALASDDDVPEDDSSASEVNIEAPRGDVAPPRDNGETSRALQAPRLFEDVELFMSSLNSDLQLDGDSDAPASTSSPAKPPRSRDIEDETASDLSSAIERAANASPDEPYHIPIPDSEPADEDIDQLIQAHLRTPDDKELAAQLIDRLEGAEDWTRLVAVLSGMVEHLEGEESKQKTQLALLNHLAEVLIEGLEDLESGSECLLRIAALVPPAEGSAQARRAASLLRQGGFDELAAEAETLARQLSRSSRATE